MIPRLDILVKAIGGIHLAIMPRSGTIARGAITEAQVMSIGIAGIVTTGVVVPIVAGSVC